MSKETNPLRILPPIVLAACSTAAGMYPVDLARALKMGQASSGAKDSLPTLLKNFIQTYGYAVSTLGSSGGRNRVGFK